MTWPFLLQYIRVDIETDLETCWTLLSDYWLMPPPKLIISVTGGAKRFFMKARLKSSFKRGLVNAATSTGAWIVTGGTATGVMEFVGEAVKEHTMTTGGSGQKIVALGIVTWGIVDNKENLMAEDVGPCCFQASACLGFIHAASKLTHMWHLHCRPLSQFILFSFSQNCGLFPAHYNIDDLSPKHARGVAPLDHNHTHFILVDNGTENKFGVEIEFRTALEQYISEKMETGVAKNQSESCPRCHQVSATVTSLWCQ